MAGEGRSRWVFTQNELSNTPSRKGGIDSDKELSYRQQAANFIQDMGQRLQVTQLCINTAIVYMHRFYMFHSFTKFHRNNIAAACLFLAAKVEEQPRKLEHVIKVAHMCTARDATPLDVKSEAYLEQAQELVVNENILLQTLGFEITVDHPHTQVVKTCQLVHASKDLAQTSYFLATNSLHLTSMCLQYKPVVVACVCIHLAIKWANLEIPCSSEGKEWWWYADKSLTLQTLEELAQDFLNTLDKCPSKLKKKILTWKAGGGTGELEPTPTGPPPKKVRMDPPSSTTVATTSSTAAARPGSGPAGHSLHKCASAPIIHDAAKPVPSSQREPILSQIKQEKDAATSVSGQPTTPDVSSRKPRPETTITPKEYLERRERERIAQATATPQSAKHTSIKTEQHRTEPYHDFSPKTSNSPLMHPSSKHRLQTEQIKHKPDVKAEVKSDHRDRLAGVESAAQSHHRSDERKSRHHPHSHRHSDQHALKSSHAEARHQAAGGEPSSVGTEAEKRVNPIKLEVKQEPDVKLSRRESHRSKEHRSRHSNSGTSHHKEHHHRKRQYKSPGSSQVGTDAIPPLKIHKGELAQNATPPVKVPSLKIKLPPRPSEGEVPNSHNGNGTTNLNHSLSSPPNSAPATKIALEETTKQIQELMNVMQRKKDKLPHPPPPSSESKPPLPPMPPPP